MMKNGEVKEHKILRRLIDPVVVSVILFYAIVNYWYNSYSIWLPKQLFTTYIIALSLVKMAYWSKQGIIRYVGTPPQVSLHSSHIGILSKTKPSYLETRRVSCVNLRFSCVCRAVLARGSMCLPYQIMAAIIATRMKKHRVTETNADVIWGRIFWYNVQEMCENWMVFVGGVCIKVIGSKIKFSGMEQCYVILFCWDVHKINESALIFFLEKHY